jgi:hypothetical protein
MCVYVIGGERGVPSVVVRRSSMADGTGVCGSIVCQYAVIPTVFEIIVSSALTKFVCRPPPTAITCTYMCTYTSLLEEDNHKKVKKKHVKTTMIHNSSIVY